MDATWWSRALGPEVVIPTLITVIFGIAAIWYARCGPVIRARQRDFAISVQRRDVVEPPVLRLNEFDLQFRGKPFTHVGEYRLVFGNTGLEPIVKSDFDQPIALKIAGSGDVYDCTATICRPKNLKINVSFDKGHKSIVVAPVLLNPGDFVCVDFIATNRPNFNFTARIRGIISFGTLRGGVYDRGSTIDSLLFVLAGLLIATMAWWVPFTMRSDLISQFQPRADWYSLFFPIMGISIVYVGIWLYRSWAFLRQARYLGGGTEELFAFGVNENIK